MAFIGKWRKCDVIDVLGENSVAGVITDNHRNYNRPLPMVAMMKKPTFSNMKIMTYHFIRKIKQAIMIKPLIVALLFLISTVCAASPQGVLSKTQAGPTSGLTLACNDAQSIAESLRIQRYPLGDESKSRLLDAMGVKIYQRHYFELMYARRISGGCVNRLGSINGSVFRFHTGVSLMLAGEGDGVFLPYPNIYWNQVIFDRNRPGPVKIPQQFTRAIGVTPNEIIGNIDQTTSFIGIREQDGKSHFIYYERVLSDEFHVGDEVFEVDNKIISIRFIPGRDGTGSMQLLLPDENGRILLSFLWVHKNLIASAENAFSSRPYKAAVSMPAPTDSICLDAEILSRSVRFQTLYWKESEPEIELMDSLGIEILPNNGIRLVGVSHINGECLEHLEDVTPSLLYFDTGVILERNERGIIERFLGLRDRHESRRHIISQDDPHPEREAYHFIQAIGVGWNKSIGIWEKDDRFTLTFYQNRVAGRFRIHHNLLSFENKIINIKFSPHTHNPSGTLWLLLENGESVMSLAFLVRIPWSE